MYFDLHLHPALKSFLTDEALDCKDDCWTTYRNCIDFAVGSIIDSQASLRQLDRGGARTAVAAIYVLEEGLDDIFLIRTLAPAISHLDKDMVRDIRPVLYWRRFLEKIRHLENSLAAGRPGHAFRIVSDARELAEGKNQLILSVEGAHILKVEDGDDPLLRLDYLKNFRHKIFYLTLCHFIRNTFCTQAFAMKLINPLKAPNFVPRGVGLTEEGKEIIRRAYATETGRRILIDVKHMSLSARQQFYEWKAADATMRDIPIIASHVGATGISWEADARRAYHREVEFLPGLDQVVVQYNRPEGLRHGKTKSYFAPTTINLYDEDIRAIITSGGLIGLMMDQRQLGVSKRPYEYFDRPDFERLNAGPGTYREHTPPPDPVLASAAEEETLVGDLTMSGYQELASLPDLGVEEFVGGISDRVRSWWDEEDDEGDEESDAPATYEARTEAKGSAFTPPRLSRKKRRHLLHLANNLLHIAKVGGPDAWRHICIGSDYDGLVDAPNNCKNVTEYRDLEAHLYNMLMELSEQEGASFRQRYHLVDIRRQLRWVMQENGHRFLQKHL